MSVRGSNPRSARAVLTVAASDSQICWQYFFAAEAICKQWHPTFNLANLPNLLNLPKPQ